MRNAEKDFFLKKNCIKSCEAGKRLSWEVSFRSEPRLSPGRHGAHRITGNGACVCISKKAGTRKPPLAQCAQGR